MSKLTVLDGGFGCGCGCGTKTPVEQAPGTTTPRNPLPGIQERYPEFVSVNAMYQQGFVPTREVLDRAQIPYTRTATDVIITDSKGAEKKLPVFVDIPGQDQLIADAQAFLTTAQARVDASIPRETQKTVLKFVGGALALGILYKIFGGSSSRSRMTGPPRRLALLKV